MILIIQYILYNLVCRRKIVSKHSDARQQWMIDSNQTKTKMNDHTSGEKINIYIFFTRKFYNLSYLAINQQRVTCLHGVSTYFLFTVTNFKVVILYRLKLLPLVDYHLVQYPQHSYEKNIHLLFGWINRYLSDTNYYISQKRTGCNQASCTFFLYVFCPVSIFVTSR